MRTRCAKFYLQGVLFLRPVPYHRDFQCWLAGSQLSCWAMFAMVPVALVGLGFAAGCYF